MKVKVLFVGSILILALVGCGSGTATQAPTETVLATPQVFTEAATEIATNAATAAIAATSTPETSGGTAAKTFALVPAESEARFVIDEVLAGQPNTVIGRTHDVEGTIALDYSNPSTLTLSTVKVDMSTLATDNPMRTQTMQRAILETSQPGFRYAEFTPKSFSGLPEKIEVGKTYEFKVTGDMSLHGVTKELTFDVTASAESDAKLKGLASVTIRYSDFGVQILRLPPQVASVADQLKLEIEFVAEAK